MRIPIKLIEKYNTPGPYYTSYPSTSQWTDGIDGAAFKDGFCDALKAKDPLPFFLYVHFPFCASQCFYCICNTVVTRDLAVKKEYLAYLSREIGLYKEVFAQQGISPVFKRMHLGGGTPNLMGDDEFDALITGLGEIMDVAALDEFSMEIDVRTVTVERIRAFHARGVSRLSFGIQEFDLAVQKAINRIQSLELVRSILLPDVRQLFSGINFDILYGLPLQTKTTFRETMKKVGDLSPDRITLLRYAHIPESRRHQRAIRQEDLPTFMDAEEMFLEASDFLFKNGYQYVGINHFAKKSDELFKAVQDHSVWRNFIGFTPGHPHHLLGIGSTSSSAVGKFYAQNVYSLSDYYQKLDARELPFFRGFELGWDDQLRRQVVFDLLCFRQVCFKEVEKRFDISFTTYFQEELQALQPFVEDGIVVIGDGFIRISDFGRIFIRQVCNVFDYYLKHGQEYKISGP